MNQFIKAFAAALFVMFSVRLQAQNTCKGYIFEKGHQDGLSGVSVYIPELKTGTVSDAEGAFSISGLQGGSFYVQFSKAGFETHFMHVYLSDTAKPLRVFLNPSLIELQEVQVVGTQVSSTKDNPLNIASLTGRDITSSGALSISDAVSRLPGVSQLTTGAGISKPVIRGLYGNRIQVQVMGVRFDNQQWQDEHGLGLSAIGVSQVEVIKGPASLMYGGDAIGGVINVIEEKPAPRDSMQQDVNLSLFSNTGGAAFDYGKKKTTDHQWWRVRAGVENHADYSSGGDMRVLNSRFAGYHLKAGFGGMYGKWVNNNNVYLSYDEFGFIFDSINRKEPDSRYSRTFDGPHHTVAFGMATSENTLYLDKTKIKINGGFITNNRQEQEGGNRISLNMLLNTAQLVVQATSQVSDHAEWTNGVSAMYQTNTNFGSRVIIPDAGTFEGSLYSYYKHYSKTWVFETGVRYDYRHIKTLYTANLGYPPGSVAPFGKDLPALNGSVGAVYNPFENFSLKGNVSSGYRSANLAELSSKGLHEGTLRWEVGDPNLKVEQNINSELDATWELGEQLELEGAAWYNRFFNYIYLAPSGQEMVGYNVYNYLQSNAVLKGYEAGLDIHPKTLKKVDLYAAYAWMDATKDDGQHLPFIPANKITAELKLKPGDTHRLVNISITGGYNYVFAQDHPSPFETSSPAYFLVKAGAGASLVTRHRVIDINIICNNLTDEKYADHLSRLRRFGFYDMGRDIVLSVHCPI